MKSEEVRKLFFEFFKKRGHTIVPSSLLVPDDPSVLFTTAGMQQFKRYFTGELNPMSDFNSMRTTSIQKSFRTSDIDKVGDDTHFTFFEMAGNFSFGPVGSDDPKDFGTGGYFKRSAIYWGYEFMTQTLQINPDRITVSIFKGDEEVPRDDESFNVWRKEIGIPEKKIIEGGRKDNFWGPTGNEGPCGPTTEIYVDGVEVWNIVFNEFYSRNGKLEKLKNPGVDTGMGFERLVSVMQGVKTVFEIDLLRPILSKIRETIPNVNERIQRITTDHLRAATFLIADGVSPSNKDAGYIVRRLIRRIAAYQIIYDIHINIFSETIPLISGLYKDFYPEVGETVKILEIFEDERLRFQRAVKQGILEIESFKAKGEDIDAKKAFYLFETFGFPFELIEEIAPKELTKNLEREEFEKEFEAHQEISRAGMEKKFGGHGLILDTGELKAGSDEDLKKVTRLHTATHLLHKALREILGESVKQMGSDITVERTRFDFSFSRKMTLEEIKNVEKIVNQKIQENLPVSFAEMPKIEAEKTGALHFFKAKYPDIVKIYYAGESLKDAYSKEFCGGPHVSRTGEIGKFKIIKEEAVAAGVRRIRGSVET